MKFEKIKAGDVLYYVHTYRMGNTTVRTYGEWKVRIVSVDADRRTAVVERSGNRPETWRESRLKKLRGKPTEFKTGFIGSKRPLTRAEKAAKKAEAP